MGPEKHFVAPSASVLLVLFFFPEMIDPFSLFLQAGFDLEAHLSWLPYLNYHLPLP